MKKIVLKSVFMAAALFFCAYAETAVIYIEPVSQVVVPRNIYVGDMAEIRYSFNASTPIVFVDDANQKGKGFSVPIDLNSVGFATDTAEYFIDRMKLEYNGNSYSVVVNLQAWTVGQVDLPAFDFGSALSGADKNISCVIDIEPISVLSLVSQGNNSLRGVAAPLLVPGTTYFLYAVVTLIFVLLVLSVVVAVRFSVVKNFCANFLIRMRHRQNVRKTFARIKKLAKKSDSVDDKFFCRELENIVRNYLGVRYGFSFSSVVSSKIVSTLVDLTSGTLSEKKESAAESLSGLFYRLDHVRFGDGAVGYVGFSADERETLLDCAKNAIINFEEPSDV